MILDDQPYTLDRVVRIALFCGLIWGLIWLLGVLSDVLVPFAVALLLAYLMNPLVTLVQKKLKHRAAAVLVSLVIVVLAFIGLGAVLVPQIASQVGDMARIIRELGTSEAAERAMTVVPPETWEAITELAQREDVEELFKSESAIGFAQAVAKRVLPGVWGVIAGTASFLMGLIGMTVVLLYLVFLLIDYDKVRDGWTNVIPPAWRDTVVMFVGDFNTGMQRYFRGQALVASLVGVMFALGFSLIGLPMAILLGLLIGLLNMVPYLQILGLIPAFLFALLNAVDTGGSIWAMLGLTALVFAVVQTIQDTVLTPRIMGEVTGLSPAMILLSLSIWGKLLGMFGLIIALPMTVLLWAYYKRMMVKMTVPAEA